MGELIQFPKKFDFDKEEKDKVQELVNALIGGVQENDITKTITALAEIQTLNTDKKDK